MVRRLPSRLLLNPSRLLQNLMRTLKQYHQNRSVIVNWCFSHFQYKWKLMLKTETSYVDSPWNRELENGFSSYVTFVASNVLQARNLAARITPSRSHLTTSRLAWLIVSARKCEAAMQWREKKRQRIQLFCAPIFRKPLKRGERNPMNSTWFLLEK